MFRVNHPSLDRCITLGAIMRTLRFMVIFSPCKSQGGFPQTFPLTTLEAFGVGDYLSYSATANAWRKQRREKLRNNVKNVWSYRVAWVFVSKT